MLLQRAEKLPEGEAWMYELKLDGFRAEREILLGWRAIGDTGLVRGPNPTRRANGQPDSFMSATRDSSGNLWFATSQGLSRLTPSADRNARQSETIARQLPLHLATTGSYVAEGIRQPLTTKRPL